MFFLSHVCPIPCLSYLMFVLSYVCPIPCLSYPLYLSYPRFVLSQVCPISCMSYTMYVLYKFCPIPCMSYRTVVLLPLIPALLPMSSVSEDNKENPPSRPLFSSYSEHESTPDIPVSRLSDILSSKKKLLLTCKSK